MKIRYYVSGLGYDENNCITDYEQDFGDFDTYEEAYELFVKLQCRSEESFFTNAPDVYELLIQLEECEETHNEITCIDIKHEWMIVNPNFDDMKMIQISARDFEAIKTELKRAYGGLIEYAETLEDTCECSQHLDNINDILDKYKSEKVEE